MNIIYSEDNKGFRGIITNILTELGHKVTSVGSAEESIEKIRSGEKFDAIISDNQMTGIRGLDLMKTPEAQSIPIRILLSLDSLKHKKELQVIKCIALSKGDEDLVTRFSESLVEKK
jgi:CheY-like chemotaxis protein